MRANGWLIEGCILILRPEGPAFSSYVRAGGIKDF